MDAPEDFSPSFTHGDKFHDLLFASLYQRPSFIYTETFQNWGLLLEEKLNIDVVLIRTTSESRF